MMTVSMSSSLALTLPLGKHPRYHGGSVEMNVNVSILRNSMLK